LKTIIAEGSYVMFNEWIDYAAVLLTLIHMGIILYAMQLFPFLEKDARKGWTWFIVGLCGIFFSRLNYTARCLELETYPTTQLVVMSVTTVFVFLYIRSKRNRAKK
jgi:hypothetical protein